MSPSRQIRYLAPTIFVLAIFACGPTDQGDDPGPEAGDPATEEAGSLTVEGEFSTPESVLHDEEGDLYLVSNINGEPLAKDGNGFISRVRPDGEIAEIKWIDGESEGVTLHAPKGMALSGDTLFVADIDSVRAFDRSSGQPLGVRGVPGASFLNDLAAGPDGSLYVTDTGVDETFSPTGTDAVYRFAEDGATAVAEGSDLANPNGIWVDGDDLIIVPFGSSEVMRISSGNGESEVLATLPGGQLDGVVRTDDGTLFVSSWEAGAIFRVSPDGAVDVLLDGVDAPADIGWDAQRRRVLIPLFMDDRVEIRSVP